MKKHPWLTIIAGCLVGSLTVVPLASSQVFTPAVQGQPASFAGLQSDYLFTTGAVPTRSGAADTYLGSYDSSTAALWLVQNGTAPSSTNYTIAGDATESYFANNSLDCTRSTKVCVASGHWDITGVNAGNYGLGFAAGTDGICFNGSGAAGCSLGMQWVSGTGIVTFTTTGGRTDFTTGLSVASGSRLALNGSANSIGWVYDGTNVALSATAGVNVVTAIGNTAQPLVGGVLNVNTTGVGNVGASGPDDLQTYQLPASTLVVTNRCIEVTARGSLANNTNSKTVRMTIGPTPTVLITKVLGALAVATGAWDISCTICRTGLSTQDYFCTATNNEGTTVSGTDGTTVEFESVFGTLTQTETNALDIKVQSTVSTSNNDIVSEMLITKAL